MSKKISILLVGIGGFGSNYVNKLLDNIDKEEFLIEGAVDPNPESCSRLNELKENNIPIFTSMDEFYNTGKNADLTIISSPIQFHCLQSCMALSHGSNVLCEKPIAATIQDAKTMLKCKDEFGNFLAIGFQWSYSSAILRLKRDIINGVLGKPRRLKSIILWPRNYRYYSRGWAAKIKDTEGNWILDSIANNATSHYLHNMLFVLGNKMDTSASPLEIKAEVYKANHIENYDTAVMRVLTEESVEIMFYAAHPVKELLDPVFYFEFENGVVVYDGNREENITARFNDGTVKNYGNPNEDYMEKLWIAINAVKNKKECIPCTVETAIPHLQCINSIQDKISHIPRFPKELIIEDENLSDGVQGVYVKGLSDILKKCYEEWSMPSEVGITWASSIKVTDLSEYK